MISFIGYFMGLHPPTSTTIHTNIQRNVKCEMRNAEMVNQTLAHTLANGEGSV